MQVQRAHDGAAVSISGHVRTQRVRCPHRRHPRRTSSRLRHRHAMSPRLSFAAGLAVLNITFFKIVCETPAPVLSATSVGRVIPAPGLGLFQISCPAYSTGYSRPAQKGCDGAQGRLHAMMIALQVPRGARWPRHAVTDGVRAPPPGRPCSRERIGLHPHGIGVGRRTASERGTTATPDRNTIAASEWTASLRHPVRMGTMTWSALGGANDADLSLWRAAPSAHRHARSWTRSPGQAKPRAHTHGLSSGIRWMQTMSWETTWPLASF